MIGFLAMRAFIRCSLILFFCALAACDRTPVYQWQVVESPDKTFTVSLPGNPTSKDTPTRLRTGESFTAHQLTARLKGVSYAISWWEDPSLVNESAERVLTLMRDRGLAPSKASLLGEHSTTFRGYPARDVIALAGGHAAYDNRIMLVRSRVYSLMVVDGSGRHDFPNVKRFYNSLVLR